MSDDSLASELVCTQCGGELRPDEGQIFITCPYCNTTVYLDKSRVVFHWQLAPTLDETQARGSLARWMAGNLTVKDLDKKSRVKDQSFAYFPLWYFKFRSDGGQDEIRQFPAAATSVTEIRRINVPAGDLQKFDDSLESQSQRPTVPLETALGWLGERGIARDQISEMAMVHIPLYSFKYTYQGNLYTAIVEGATGKVFANVYPAKSESPYRLIGFLAASIYLCLATFPIIGAILNNWVGLGIGILAYVGLGIILGLLLFAFAIWVAAKV